MEGIYTALIAAGVSVLSTLVTIYTTRGNLKLKINELKLKEVEIEQRQVEFKKSLENKEKELENTKITIERELEELRQVQLNQVIEKRIEAYPKLWAVFIEYGTEWFFEEKEYSAKWARDYLNALRACNKEYGVFFSQDVYRSYHELRMKLTELVKRFETGQEVTQQECKMTYAIITVGTKDVRGLSAVMKDDLGSYRNSVIQTRIDEIN